MIWLSEFSREIACVETAEALSDLLARAARQLGFTALHIAHPARAHLAFTSSAQADSTLPPSRNLLVRLARRRKREFVWNLAQAKPHIRQKYAALLDDHGIGTGVSIPLCQGPRYLGTLTLGAPEGFAIIEDDLSSLVVLAHLAMLRGQTLEHAKPQGQIRNALSPQQDAILQWMSLGKTNREIGMITGMRHRTVDYHVQEILKKLNVSTRAQAVAIHIRTTQDPLAA